MKHELIQSPRTVLADVIHGLQDVQELHLAEAALDSAAHVLDMPWVCWVPDTSHPYYCREMDEFARNHGWPEELLRLWWNKHAALKMPFYIRCRFEHLPFVSSLKSKRKPHSTPVSSEHARVSELVAGMGVSTMLTVPVHLPKGQVSMVTWAGSRSVESLKEVLSSTTGDLLGICHLFMRVANSKLDRRMVTSEEHARLTPREWDCLRTLAQGYREAEVAAIAGISKATVRYHLDNIVQKFGCRNRLQAVALVAQLGLLGPIGS
jgi:DNA-binding CsgD family transcriptional regulator